MFQSCQAFGALLRDARGAVVNVASQAALVSLPMQSAYSASKGAVAALTRSLAIDWAEHGVRVNAVAPGFTVTPMTEAFFENETFTTAATKRIPLGRLLLADEIAGAIVYLASPLASASRASSCPSTAAGRPVSLPCPGRSRGDSDVKIESASPPIPTLRARSVSLSATGSASSCSSRVRPRWTRTPSSSARATSTRRPSRRSETCKRVLEAGGSSLENVVKVTIFLTDMSNFEKIVELRGKWFTPPYPADTIVEVSSLAFPELMIEIEAIAVADEAVERV